MNALLLGSHLQTDEERQLQSIYSLRHVQRIPKRIEEKGSQLSFHLPHSHHLRLKIDYLTELCAENRDTHSFIHYKHLYSASSSGATQWRSQPQHDQIEPP